MLPPCLRLGLGAWVLRPGLSSLRAHLTPSPGFAFQLVRMAGSPAWWRTVQGHPCPAALSLLGVALPSAPGFGQSPPQDWPAPGLHLSLGVPAPQFGPSSDLGCEACGLAGLALPLGLLCPLLVTGSLPILRSESAPSCVRSLPHPAPRPDPGPSPHLSSCSPLCSCTLRQTSVLSPNDRRATGGSKVASAPSSRCLSPACWLGCASRLLGGPSALLLALHPWVSVLLTTLMLCPLPCISLVTTLATLL